MSHPRFSNISLKKNERLSERKQISSIRALLFLIFLVFLQISFLLVQMRACDSDTALKLKDRGRVIK